MFNECARHANVHEPQSRDVSLQVPINVGAARSDGIVCCDRPDLARLTALVTGALTLVSCGTLVGLTLALRRQLAMAFSNDPQVIAVAAAAMPILAASLLGDGVNCACSGALVFQALLFVWNQSLRCLFGR
jgi:hypothetical protein